jgi:hypothetical protein
MQKEKEKASLAEGKRERKRQREKEKWKEKEEGDSRPRRLHIAPVRRIHLIHLGKVLHIGEKDIDLDDVLETRSCRFQDGAQVLDALVLSMTEHPLVNHQHIGSFVSSSPSPPPPPQQLSNHR